MGREFELKYRASANQMAAIKAKYQGFREITMETTYYDTPTRSLSARKWTLRQRLENGTAVCTLKTPHRDGGRGEWETACEDLMAAVPVLCKLGAPMELLALVSGGVTPVCGARFTRLACLLTLANCTVELALDRGALLGGGKELPLCEVEVELKSGSEEAAAAFAKALAAEYGLMPETASKYRRALTLALENNDQEKDNGI